jgi:hypothetical protein
MAQQVFQKTTLGIGYLCTALANATAGWSNCDPTSVYYQNMIHAVGDAVVGLCYGNNMTVDIMLFRHVIGSNYPPQAWPYYATCWDYNFGMYFNCSRNDCLPGTCAANQVCLDYPNAVCYCNETGVLVEGPCPTPPSTPKPTRVPTEPLTVPGNSLPIDTIVILGLGLVFGLITLIAIVWLYRNRSYAKRWTLLTLYISTLDLTTDLALCFTLWALASGKSVDGTIANSMSHTLILALAVVQVTSVVIGGLTGVILAGYLLWSESMDQKISHWIEKNATLAGSVLVLAAVDVQNVHFFSSLAGSSLSCEWSKRACATVDKTSAALLVFRNTPQLCVQISLIVVSDTTALPFVALVVSVLGLLWGIGRRLAAFVILSRTGLPTKVSLARFKSSNTLDNRKSAADFELSEGV